MSQRHSWFVGSLVVAFLLIARSALAEPPASGAAKLAPATGSPAASSATKTASVRAESLREQSTTGGGTGLLHLQDPLAGAPATFRVSLLLDTYWGSGFLCDRATPCTGSTNDSNHHFGSSFGLSVTPLAFLEAYASLRSFVNSDSARTPSLTSSVGNSKLGIKLFTPEPIAEYFHFGGAAELDFLGDSGSVGLSGRGTSARLRALALADLRGAERHGLPLRARVNLSYFLDNSAELVESAEQQRNGRITRIERSGLEINRVDQFELGLGVDALFAVARPFAEWNLGIPVNRQGYRCYPDRAFPGDGCLATSSKLSAFPSKLTLGSRFYPALPGLAATAAFDIGTSGTSAFIEELSPTLPWDVWLGVSYGFDVTPPQPVVIVKRVEQPPPPKPVERRLRGFVHEAGKAQGIAIAVLNFQGRDVTGLVTMADGHFVSQNLEPGSYTLTVAAPGYEPGECIGTIPAPGAARAEPSDMDCELVAAPPFGSVSGHVRNAAGTPLSGATVKLKDRLNRELAVTTDPAGAFEFGRLLPGATTLRIELSGHLLRVEALELGPRENARLELSLREKPKPSHIKLTPKELLLTQPLRFDAEAREPTADSSALLEEIADALDGTPAFTHVEIQAYTDASGAPERDQALTDERAAAVRDWLTQHGIDGARLSTKGFGSTHPASPNITPAGRARNRRVRFVILE